ncbi:integrase arm-type DNA-binding domain-containing protein [Methylobacter sp.]|uniref:tyrosine-type recombinase/integrase n=1 Tax=Methylobacter sp. TaxID=2051955 RepID=UPI002487F64C|nr:integrase arm-type DNA-binding domain-containing protein [Methylobacter sp.]MDI1278518.1 integrase arm-type DNA-binding domain-containing protein [Methylobacter sp.]MDI1359286.1 integrase arm-type DNA-binding domain-containing protein [Methylobacter sp.]
MSRIKNKLTARTVETKKAPGYYSDGGNLYLRVSQNLTKTWAFYYKKDGKRTEMGLGSFGNVSLEQAREKAAELRKQIANGIDPLGERQQQENERKAQRAKMMTFSQCADAYINAHRAGWKNPKHIQQWQNTLSQYTFPVFGDLDVKAIDTGLITKCLEPIWLTKNETAGRVRGRIESILDWATVHEYREGVNPARWRGHLDKLLAKPSKIQKTEHHKALPYTEINEFIHQLHQQDGIAAKCLEFTILTAARTGETIGATWDEIDLDAKTWTIPAVRMKAEREHRVPLSADALNILNEMAVVRFNGYVFPGNKKGLSNMAMLAVLKRMDRAEITVHGFRSTFRDWAAESTAYPGEVVEMALAHAIKNQTEAAYRRGDLLEKRSRLMEDWARYCKTSRSSADVVPIKKIA